MEMHRFISTNLEVELKSKSEKIVTTHILRFVYVKDILESVLLKITRIRLKI